MAHTKSLGTSKLGRDSAAKRLGVKLHDGQKVNAGNIIIRQRGSKYLAGKNVKIGADDTLYAAVSGIIKFSTVRKLRFDGTKRIVKSVAVQVV
jgi:large subunit ribosomal protein L27